MNEGVKARSSKWRISEMLIPTYRKWPLIANLLSLVSSSNLQDKFNADLQNHDKTATKGVQGESDAAFNKDFAILQGYLLSTVTTKMNTFAMCLSKQFPTQAHLTSFGQTEHWKRSFIHIMLQEFPTGEFKNWAKCKQLLPHVKLLYHMQPSTVELSIAWAQTLANAAWYLWKTGKYNMAQDFLVKALEVMELVLEPYDEQMLSSVEIMAGVMSSQGRYSQAEELHWQALKGFKKRFGLHHPFTLTSMSNLALVLQHQGKHQDAEKLNRKALEGSEIVLGICHVDTLTSVSNLALVLQHQGKFEEAVELNLQALKGFQEQLGLQHPSTLTSISNLACVLQFQGNYRDSEELNWLVFQGRLKELGVHHPSTQTTVRNLAWVLRAQGQVTLARSLEQQALEDNEGLQVYH